MPGCDPRTGAGQGGPSAPADADWFATRWLADGVAVLAEPGHVNSYLVVGSRRAVLFDSGTGIEPILPRVRALTGLPVLVVNSHDHLDHRGGNAELAAAGCEIAVSSAGEPVHDAAPEQYRDRYRAMAVRSAEVFARFADLDAQGPYTLTPDERPRPLPDLGGWRLPAVRPSRGLRDGERIELGDRSLVVRHTPGHSPDGLCLWDADTGVLLSGDTVLAAAYWTHGPRADVAVFADTLARLRELPLRRVLVAHNLRCELGAEAVDRAAAAMAAVAAGRTRPVPARDPLDRPVLRHDHAGVTVLTAAA